MNGLLGKGIEVVYSSDLGRAAQTASIIRTRLDLSVKIDHLLRERHLGSMQGMTKKEFRDRFPEEIAGFDSGDPEYVSPGGEGARTRGEIHPIFEE